MGIYAQYIFPRVMDWILGARRFQEQRMLALASVRGSVLEIGFGTGLNLPHYPAAVTELTAVDSETLLPTTVARRAAELAFVVKLRRHSAEGLPFAEAQFDSVVSTWTLCTINDAVAALREARRVLKPDGQFIFLEHGRSEDPRVAQWQDRLNPLQRLVACGCNLNRRIDSMIGEAGLKITHLERFTMPGVPRIAGEMYQGVATHADRA